MKILIIGGGAVGAYYGWRLSQAGHSMDIVCRANYREVKNNGFVIRINGSENHFLPRMVIDARDASLQEDAFDFIFIAVKAVGGKQHLDLVRKASSNSAVLCIIQNGLDVEYEIARTFPQQVILSLVPYIAAAQTAPGRVECYSSGHVAIGSIPAGASKQAEQLASCMAPAGIRCTVVPDIRLVRWQKAVWNVGFNSVSALSGGMGTRQMLENPESRKLIEDLMEEVCLVASADGYPLPKDFVDFNLQATLRMADYVPSTAQDMRRGKVLEVEAMFGNILRVASQHGVSTPRLEAITRLLRLVSSTEGPSSTHASL